MLVAVLSVLLAPMKAATIASQEHLQRILDARPSLCDDDIVLENEMQDDDHAKEIDVLADSVLTPTEHTGSRKRLRENEPQVASDQHKNFSSNTEPVLIQNEQDLKINKKVKKEKRNICKHNNVKADCKRCEKKRIKKARKLKELKRNKQSQNDEGIQKERTEAKHKRIICEHDRRKDSCFHCCNDGRCNFSSKHTF